MVASIGLIVTSCGGDSVNAGPLAELFDSGAARTCMPTPMGESATFANIYISNPTNGELVVTDLTFAETDGVTLLGSVISDPTLDVVAAGRGWPPDNVPDDVWAQTHPLVGARIGDHAVPYAADGTEYELISLGLRLDQDRRSGSARSAVLDYAVDGERYEVEIDRTYVLRPKCG
jgi:hypothetical protein